MIQAIVLHHQYPNTQSEIADFTYETLSHFKCYTHHSLLFPLLQG